MTTPSVNKELQRDRNSEEDTDGVDRLRIDDPDAVVRELVRQTYGDRDVDQSHRQSGDREPD